VKEREKKRGKETDRESPKMRTERNIKSVFVREREGKNNGTE